MKKLFLLLFLPGFAFAQGGKEYKIKGELKNFKPIEKIYLSYRDGEKAVRDSVTPDKGEFKFEGNINEPAIANVQVRYQLQPGQERPKVEIAQFYLEPTKISIDAADSLKESVIKGGAGQTDFAKLQNDQKDYEPRFKPLVDEWNAARKAENKEVAKKLEDQLDVLNKEMKEKVFGTFVRNNPNSPLALYALRQYAGWDIDVEKIKPLFVSLPASVKQTKGATDFKELLDIAEKTSVGKYAIDFTQNDTLGRPVALSSFKGKYVFVDFWASWCGPCRRENPNIVKAFNKHKDKNFTILGVSLDQPTGKEKWIKAIHDDNLTWTQVSDLKFWDNEAAKLYGIKAIPQNFLLDPQGKIIAKNLDGEELDQKLSEVLK